MERILSYAIAGCFVGTIISLFLYAYNSNPFLLFLIPMWSMILSISIAKVVDLYRQPSGK